MSYNTLMADVIIIPKSQALYDLVVTILFGAGWVIKGLFYAMCGEIIFKPIARRLQAKAERWEQYNPERLRFFLHFIENHTGFRPSQCLEGKCVLPRQ